MVMATGSVCQQYGTGDLSHHEASGAAGSAAASAGDGADVAADGAGAALHERLVAYVHALAPPHEARSGVWGEHSYARARAAAHAPAAHVRVLLAPPADPSDDLPVDVERVEQPPPEPPRDSPEPREPSEPSDPRDDDEDDWEPRVTALAPGAAHLALAERALDALRRLHLAHLAVGPGRVARGEHVRAAARRLRHALVAAVAAPGPAAQRPGPWLHATLLAYMPRGVRRLYDAAVAELRRAAPRLAERALGPGPAAARGAARTSAGPGAEAPVWLVWLEAGDGAARWRARLGALLHVRPVAVARPTGSARPDAWCAAVAGATRHALADTLAEAGTRAVILGGAGIGATLCLALAAAGPPVVPGAGGPPAAVRGLLLLAPPLLTAEGARDSPDDSLGEVRLPTLVVTGTGAAASWRGAVRGVCGAGTGRRVLEVRGADDALRAPRALRLRRRLPQLALDAAIAEECARWALETAESARALSPPPPPPSRSPPPRSPPRPAPRRRAPPPQRGDDDEEDYAHLPDAADARLVSRGPGGTPLALLPPRRAAAPPALAAADIMRLPIVFADDEAVAPLEDAAPPDSPVTVTSGDSAARGAGPYTRVIVASRSRGAGAAPRGAGGGPPRGARPLLLRHAVRVLPRAAPRHTPDHFD